MHYQVEGHKGDRVINQRNYASTQHSYARDFAKQLVTLHGCDSARVLKVESAETFYPENEDEAA